jgi:hypothetical protein
MFPDAAVAIFLGGTPLAAQDSLIGIRHVLEARFDRIQTPSSANLDVVASPGISSRRASVRIGYGHRLEGIPITLTQNRYVDRDPGILGGEPIAASTRTPVRAGFRSLR